jgi:hypothetical protein
VVPNRFCLSETEEVENSILLSGENGTNVPILDGTSRLNNVDKNRSTARSKLNYWKYL